MRMKKRFLACAVLVILFTLVTQSTLAYFSTTSTARNVITSGKIEVKLVEKTGDATGDLLKLPDFEDVDGVVPGMDVSKIVFVQNTAEESAWVRIKCDVKIEGFTPAQVAEAISLDYDRENWTQGEDGYWYCNDVLEGGALTKPLFTAVTFNTTMGNEYQACTATIDVSAQAVQYKNNPIPENGDVTDIPGWPNS